jgi:hypothetical protein
MCRAMVLRAPLASVEEVEEVEEVDLDELWRLAFQEVEGDLHCLVTIARAVGITGGVAEAEDAIRSPVTHTEIGRLRGLQLRKDAATTLATRLARAGHRSAVISEWAEGVDRQVRQRLA